MTSVVHPLFADDFLRVVENFRTRTVAHNEDRLRFPQGMPVKDLTPSAIRQHTDRILAQARSYQFLYETWADEASRLLMLDLLAYRVLGAQHVRLPTNNTQYWEAIRTLQNCMVEKHVYPISFLQWKLSRFNLAPVGFPVTLLAHELNVLCTFLLEMYRYSTASAVVEIEPGDVVIDFGACWGDTALYAACKTGSAGQVHSFEIEPENLAVLNKNLEMNPHLQKTIHWMPRAAWRQSGVMLTFQGQGPGTSLIKSPSSIAQVQSITLDDYVQEKNLDRVDFVKMDIEGSELAALEGARITLARYRPKLAVSLYHQDEDLLNIPRFVQSLGLGYKLYLGHFTIHQEETVLFATARD